MCCFMTSEVQLVVTDSSALKGHWGAFSLPLSELYSLRRARFALGRNFLVVTSRGGHPLPALHFHRGGTQELLRALRHHISMIP